MIAAIVLAYSFISIARSCMMGDPLSRSEPQAIRTPYPPVRRPSRTPHESSCAGAVQICRLSASFVPEIVRDGR